MRINILTRTFSLWGFIFVVVLSLGFVQTIFSLAYCSVEIILTMFNVSLIEDCALGGRYFKFFFFQINLVSGYILVVKSVTYS